MIIGITGEIVWGTVARGCLVFFKLAKKNTDNLNSETSRGLVARLVENDCERMRNNQSNERTVPVGNL